MLKFAITIALLFTTAVTVLSAGYKNVSSKDARRLIEEKKNIYLLDVRTPEEFREVRMKGSILIPINEIERRIVEVPKNRPVLVFCAVGARSNLVAGFLAGKGFGEVYNMQDGLIGWSRNGFPVEK